MATKNYIPNANCDRALAATLVEALVKHNSDCIIEDNSRTQKSQLVQFNVEELLWIDTRDVAYAKLHSAVVAYCTAVGVEPPVY
jgi:hypothetical protein